MYAHHICGLRDSYELFAVNGVRTDLRHCKTVAQGATRLNHCEDVELLPYHFFGGAKASALSKDYSTSGLWLPTREQLSSAKRILEANGIPVF